MLTVSPSAWFHGPSFSPVRRIFVPTGELGSFGIIEILFTSYIVGFVPFRTLYTSVCVVGTSATFTEPSFSSFHYDSAPIDESGDFWGVLRTYAIFTVVIMSI